MVTYIMWWDYTPLNRTQGPKQQTLVDDEWKQFAQLDGREREGNRGK